MTVDYLVAIAMGVKTTTYFKLMYPIYSGVKDYGIMHIAIFGVN